MFCHGARGRIHRFPKFNSSLSTATVSSLQRRRKSTARCSASTSTNLQLPPRCFPAHNASTAFIAYMHSSLCAMTLEQTETVQWAQTVGWPALYSPMFALSSGLRTKTEAAQWTQMLGGPCLALRPKPYWRLTTKSFHGRTLEHVDKDLQEAHGVTVFAS